MPYKDPEKQKEYLKEYSKKYGKKNKELIKKQKSEYRQTPIGIKIAIINNWKQRGVIETEQYTFDELYEAYLYHTNCEECGVTLTTGRYTTKTTKCLDHDHDTGLFRNVLCFNCNILRK